MDRAQVEAEVWAEHGPGVLVQVGDVELVAGRAHDRVDGLARPVGERDRAVVDPRDRGAADDAAVGDLREVVLAQRQPGDEDVAVGLGRAERGRVPGDPQDALAQHPAQLGAGERAPLEGAERRVPLPVRRDAVDDLLDDVARLAERRHDRRAGREIGRDLEAADPVAVHERPPACERRGAGIVERVDQRAPERVEPGREARLAEAPGRDDHAVEPLAVDVPARRDPRDGRAQPDPIRQAERRRVGVQVGADLLRGRMERMVRRRGEVGERGHRAARVRPHARPDAAVRGGRVPLPAEVVGGLEDRGLEARLHRVLRGGEAAGAGSDDRDARARSQSHGPTLTAPMRRRSTCRRIQRPANDCSPTAPSKRQRPRVRRARRRGVDDQPQVAAADRQHVAVERDRADLGMGERLARRPVLRHRPPLPALGEARARAPQVVDQPPQRLVVGMAAGRVVQVGHDLVARTARSPRRCGRRATGRR